MDSELFKIVLTSSLTISGGIVVFVGGQIASKFFIDPIHRQDELLGEIANLLILYANLTYDRKERPPDKDPIWQEIENASRVLRQKASQLRAATYSIRWYRLFRFIRMIRLKSGDANKISSHLIGWSNHLLGGVPESCIHAREKIGNLTGIKVHE